MICVELSKSLPRPQLNVAVVMVSIWSITAGWAHIESHASWLRDWSSDVRAELSVLESRRRFVDRDYQPEESSSFCKAGVSASDFLTLAGTSTAIASPDGDIEIGFRNFGDSPSSVLKTLIPGGSQVTVTISSSLNQDMWIVTSLTPNKRVCLAPDLD